MKPEIIPFGKYKNQPVDVLKQDTQSMEWLVNQDWFRERYPSINTLIVNNFHQPNDTPEHNQLVSCFLSDDFLTAFSYHILHDKINFLFDDEILRRWFTPGFALSRFDDLAPKLGMNLSKGILDLLTAPQLRNAIKKELENIEYQCEGPFYDFNDIIFEHKRGADIVFNCRIYQTVRLTNLLNEKSVKEIHHLHKNHNNSKILMKNYYDYYDFCIEVKPVLSDDYPSIIRQCRDQSCNVLFFDQFTATGATLDQVRKMFTDIYFVQKSDVEKLM